MTRTTLTRLMHQPIAVTATVLADGEDSEGVPGIHLERDDGKSVFLPQTFLAEVMSYIHGERAYPLSAPVILSLVSEG